MRLFVVAALPGFLTLVGAPATALPEHTHPAAICVKAEVRLPRGVHVGGDLWFDGSITNCGRTTNLHWIMRLTAPCKGQAYRAEERGRFLGGLTVHTPPNSDRVACLGRYRMVAKAFHKSQLVDRASQYVRVKP